MAARVAWLLMVHCLIVATAAFAQESVAVTLLLDDTRFERGFIVWAPKAGSHEKQGELRPGDHGSEPVWGLAQWHSRFTLAEAVRQELPDGGVRYADGAKAVTFYPTEGEADISFALHGQTEYQNRSPRPGDAWPHLLAERELLAHPSVRSLKQVSMHLRCRLVHAEIHRPLGFDPRRHTAQFVFYITVQNRNRRSAGFGDYFWFGVPIYDARDRLPRARRAVDRGSDRKPATGKFIFNPGGERYTVQSVHDGDWVTIEKDLLPLIVEGLETAWDLGHLPDSRDTADYRLMAMNTGWEVTGPLDVEMQLEGLRLQAVVRTD